MSSNRSRGTAKKSAKRTKVVDEVMAALSDDRIFNTLDYRKKSEAYLKQYMHQPLQRRIRRLCEELFSGQSPKSIASKASEALLWEGDVNTTVNHIRFLGVQHRPDFVVKLVGIRIAVEVKRGAVRECHS